MPDLESRLRAEAQRPISPPDFDEALRAASNAPRHTSVAPIGRRRPNRSWLAVAAAVVTVLVGAAALTLTGGRGDRGSAPAASHSPAGPVSFTPRIVGIAFGPNDAKQREYMVFTTAPQATPFKSKFGGTSQYCVDAPRVDVIETATQIRLRGIVLRRADGKFHCLTEGLPDPLDGGLLAGGVDALKQPLGNRTVVDDRTGRPVEVFVPTFATPSDLPAGYAVKYGNATDPMTTTWSDRRPGFLAPMSFAHAFGPQHGPNRNAPGGLVVIEAPHDTVNPGAKVIDHVSINGNAATVTEIADTRCVTWTAAGRRGGLQVCDDIKYFRQATLLSETELVRVARSLP